MKAQKGDFVAKGQCLLKVLVTFTREADDEVCGNPRVGKRITDKGNRFPKRFGGVAARHAL